MDTPKHAFREYDIRGKADVELTDELVTGLGRALATHLRDGTVPASQPLSFAVARDCRLSSDRLFDALCAGLTSSGANVIDLGVGPTPLLYFGAHHLKTDGAVMITGSHNPAEDNGFKMMRGTATLFGPDVHRLQQIIEQDRFADGPQGSVSAQDLSTAYCQALGQAIDLEGLSTDLSVVVDGGNGSAGPLGLRALGELGFRPDGLFCDMDGTFPNHHPDPTVEDNLVALRQRVASTGAQLGIAWDGDGDRIGVIDDRGGIVWGDKLMVLFSRGVLATHPGATILGEVKCSQTLFADIGARGGNPLICRTGHSLIKKRMKEEKALLAGEMSGHIFFADRYFGFDDAIYAAARLLELVAREGKGPRELLADLPTTAVTPEIRRACSDATKFAVVDRVLEHFRATHDVLDVDGARINFGDDAWGLCRASNTGPVLVLRFEARSEARRDEIRAEVEAVVAAATRELGDA
ncbi:MAG: phosphomannomutase/phosphoglucomutase [Deltaproteobacteria bacterium]|nr:phosphomannomutase/phosphoglucomutase [Deltaproteobacteria bacterium]